VRLRRGLPFLGLAAETERRVLEETGIDLTSLPALSVMLIKRAAKFETIARLFDYAANMAAEEGNLKDWERFCQRSGWIGSKAFLAIQDVIKVLGDHPHVVDYEELLESEAD